VSVSVTEQGHRVVVGVRSERDTWLGRAVETLLDQDEQRVLLAAGELMRRLAEFEQPDPAETPDRRAPDRRTGRNAS
jgi:hypothetical protein